MRYEIAGFKRPVFALSVLAFGAEPVYDAESGVTPEAVAGAMAGTFALRTVSTTLVHVPLLGDKEGGGHNVRLSTRRHDEEKDVYYHTSRRCGGRKCEVAGVKTEAPQSIYRKAAESTLETIVSDHERGTYSSVGHVQVLGDKGHSRSTYDRFTTPSTHARDSAPLICNADCIRKSRMSFSFCSDSGRDRKRVSAC